MKNHPLCRPPRGAINIVRLGQDNAWRDDNGAPGHVFVGQVPEAPHDHAIIWIANCKCPYPNGCPLGHALDFIADRGLSSTIQRRAARYLQPRPKKKRKRR